jgi:hypothetical protein
VINRPLQLPAGWGQASPGGAPCVRDEYGAPLVLFGERRWCLLERGGSHETPEWLLPPSPHVLNTRSQDLREVLNACGYPEAWSTRTTDARGAPAAPCAALPPVSSHEVLWAV